mmetsp:Transcript_17298/g.31133  ORF Transcript_17298/g.31133 Transcript_17298/m.31133 type:complete len:517 (+) Transcript_17298:7658-9208(+)|eukprot:CAMPEP_0204915740 /NCGR_PEP_ID=MMETSP1397-20131031/13693_1 /ASSEMBLY_ACC=CAM_ASM_000891 /TAXON_ID=49980 /ORGANISM="Climacostomum Climacostomum virens, Strain Stock W-24" /LENGTH=516 /DNA_ID=CAMNT_0052087933 /DNA_START=3536 /DNA_END=5086 /DNA_ORIENTATION=-
MRCSGGAKEAWRELLLSFKMRNTQLLAVYNDPKLNRFRESARLKPLFKKRFNVSELPTPAELPRTEESLPTLHPNLTEATLHATSQASRIRPVSGIKSETTDITRHPGELGLAELKVKLQRLKSERLELLKDLWTYEEKYDKKLSMRARLLEMRGFCNYLEEMTASSLEHIQDEQNLYDKMLVGIQSLMLRSNKEEVAAVPQAEEEDEEEESTFQVAAIVSGLHCLAFIKFDKSIENFTLILHLDTACEVYSYDLANFRLPSQEYKLGGQFLRKALKHSLLPKFELQADQDKLSIVFNDAPKNDLTILAQLAGSQYFYTQLQVSESQDKQDWILLIQDSTISPTPVTMQVPKANFGPNCQLKSMASSEQAQLAEEIKNRVSLIREDTVSLGLDMEQWRLDAPTDGAPQTPTLEFMKTVESPELQRDRYGEFEKLIAKGTANVLNTQAEVEISFNTVLELCRLTVTVDSYRKVIRAEEFPEVFDLLHLLQFESLDSYPQTLLKSLELRYVLTKLFTE